VLPDTERVDRADQRQQHVIRQTHQHLQQPPAQENLRLQDLGKLASARLTWPNPRSTCIPK